MLDKKVTSNRFVKIFAGVAIFFLSGVLVLTLGRVLNLQDVLQRPKASGLYCADGSSCGSGEVCGESGYCEKVLKCVPGNGHPAACNPGSEQCDPKTGEWYCPGNKPAEKCVPGNGHPAPCFPGQEVCDKATGSWYCPFDKPPTASPTPKPGGGGDGSIPKSGGGGGGGGGLGGAPVVNTAGCNAQSPGCVWSCYQQTGSCSGCIVYNANGCKGALPGKGGTKGDNAACFDSCYSKTGNGSGCKAACDASATCFPQCLTDGKDPKSCIVPCASGTYLTPTPVPGGSEVVCQGNVEAPGKCFSCLRDEGGDQLNIYDFSCFAARYGQEVGKL